MTVMRPQILTETCLQRKKVDPRIRTLVENGVKLRQRSLFIIVGDKGRDQVRIIGAQKC